MDDNNIEVDPIAKCIKQMFSEDFLMNSPRKMGLIKREREINPVIVSILKSRVKCIFELSKSSAKAGFRFQNIVSYP